MALTEQCCHKRQYNLDVAVTSFFLRVAQEDWSHFKCCERHSSQISLFPWQIVEWSPRRSRTFKQTKKLFPTLQNLQWTNVTTETHQKRGSDSTKHKTYHRLMDLLNYNNITFLKKKFLRNKFRSKKRRQRFSSKLMKRLN